MSGSGRGGDNRGNRKQPFKRRDRENNSRPQNRDAPKGGGKRAVEMSLAGEGRAEKKRGSLYERPKWVPPKPPAVPLPSASCTWCDKPIKDIFAAISEPGSGKPVHFDCVIDKIVEREILETGDTVSYIGGGRFGVVHFNNPPDTRDFKIKKIIEWENKENRSEWRVSISDHFSVT
jgi:hypothetical protein